MDSKTLTAVIFDALLEPTRPGGMSLMRLAKQLGVSASTLMRHLSGMGSMPMGSSQGLGWVRLILTDGRWTVELTNAGNHQAELLRQQCLLKHKVPVVAINKVDNDR